MGIPVSRFIAASNRNDVLPEFLQTGIFQARPSVPTLSNAMDVGNPSNFPRLLELCGGTVDGMRAVVRGERVSEAETQEAIRQAYADSGVVLDPHGAVAYAAAQRYLSGTSDTGPAIALMTAHPAKFAGAIERELGFAPALPEHERDWQTRPLQAVDLSDATTPAFHRWLRRLGDEPAV